MRLVLLGTLVACTACSIHRSGLLEDAGDFPPDVIDAGSYDADAQDAGDAEVDAPSPDTGTRDAGAPFELVPAIGSIDGTWACSAAGTLSLGGVALVELDTVTGRISRASGAVLRPPGLGVDDESGIRFEIAAQPPPAPPIGVFSFTVLTIPSGTTLAGSGANALGLVACDEIHVEGTIDVAGATGQGAGPGAGGPGGFAGGEGDGRPAGNAQGADGTGGEAGVSDQTPSATESGGGGGGFGARGGSGGAIADDPGGAGGGSAGSAELVPLRGGGGGGAGGGECLSSGGGGGGAVYLGANGGVWIETDGAGIDAGGGGGERCSSSGNAGAGGGAGGGILIEAPTVTLGAGAVLAANGGGGGAGRGGTSGERGPLAPARASGGTSGAPGGSGGAAGDPSGASGAAATDGGGGGGGGAGRVRINALPGGAVLDGVTIPTATDLDPGGVPLMTLGTAARR